MGFDRLDDGGSAGLLVGEGEDVLGLEAEAIDQEGTLEFDVVEAAFEVGDGFVGVGVDADQEGQFFGGAGGGKGGEGGGEGGGGGELEELPPLHGCCLGEKVSLVCSYLCSTSYAGVYP